MGTRNDDISLKLAKAVKAGFLPDVYDHEVDILTKEARVLFGSDTSLATRQNLDLQDAKALQWARIALSDRNNSKFMSLHIGDSITWNYTNQVFSQAERWASVYRDELRRRFPCTPTVTGGFGFRSVRQDFGGPSFSDITVVNTGGANNEGAGFGIDGQAKLLTAGNKQVYTVTDVTGIDLMFAIYGGGGTFSWKIDSGATTNIDTNGATNFGAFSTAIRGLSAGVHTLEIAHVSGGTVYFNGIYEFNGDETKGIHSAVAAFPSTASTFWWDTNKNHWFNYIPYLLPDLITIELGPNDYAGTPAVPVATFKTNLKNIIAEIKLRCGYNPSFILLPTWPLMPNAPVASWQAYVDAMYEVALEDATESVCVHDWQARTSSIPDTTINGILATDKTHPSPKGNRYLGEGLAAKVGTQ